MKKYVVISLAVLLAVMAISLVWAAQRETTQAAGAGQMPPMMGGMCSMTGSSAVTVSGDTIYVVKGNSLYKFDRDLKLVKRAELEPGSGMPRQGMMGTIGTGCPMMSAPAAGSQEDHSQHHD